MSMGDYDAAALAERLLIHLEPVLEELQDFVDSLKEKERERLNDENEERWADFLAAHPELEDEEGCGDAERVD